MAKTPLPQEAALDLDRHGVLRIPALLWIALALMARHWVLLLIVGVSARRDSSSVLLLGDGGIPWVALAMEVPAVLLAFVAFNRKPDGGAWARLLWRRGPEIIALTALLNVAWTANLLIKSDYWTPWPELFLASCSLIDVAIALSMYTTPYYRQLFDEFPARPETPPQP